MKRNLTIIFTLFFCLSLLAQSQLPNSLRHSLDTHIYKLTKSDLEKVYIKGGSFSEDMLTNLIAKYKTKGTIPQLERGNYVKVRAVENELVFEDLTIDNLQTQVIPAKEFVLCLYDTLGNVINDATVKLGNSKMRLSKENHTYSIAKAKNEQIVEINNNGVYHYLNVRNWDYQRNRKYRTEDNKDKYLGFVVFSKPKYKPNETVKLKAYLADKNGTKYNKPISIRLKDYYADVDTVLTNLNPYSPGMYTFDFPLSTQLDLTLDRSYEIILETDNKKANKISGSFSYEDYELKSINLSVESNKKDYYLGDSIEIKAKVTNENNMPVYGGKIEVEVTPSYFNYFSTENIKNGKVVFIPNELWTKTFEFKDLSEKTIIIPDSIFPSETSIPFSVKCTYWSSDNEVHTEYLSLKRSSQKYNIEFSMNNGMLSIRELLLDKPTKNKAKISFIGTDKLEQTIMLPDTIAVPWVTNRIEVETNNTKGSYILQNIYEEQLGYKFYRSNDSIILNVENPANIPFWYTIEKMSKTIAQGYTTQLDHVIKDTKGEGYSMQIIYLFGGKSKVIEKSLPFTKKNITLDVDMAATVYPGQKTNVNLSVSDLKGKPVKDVDITAYGFTSKFGTQQMPDLPFGGIEKTAKAFSNTYYQFSPKDKANNAAFGNGKWLSAFDLDTIPYYQFLYPDPFYSFTSETTDGSTQVSPYIVIDGALQGVHMMWIDNRLFYANQAQQLQTYTFDIAPGEHNFIFRTYDREIQISNVVLEKGKRYTLSFEASKDFKTKQTESSLSDMIATVKMVDKKDIGKLLDVELAELRNQLISISNNFGSVQLNKNSYETIENPGILKAGKNIYYINPSSKKNDHYTLHYLFGYDNSILVGPFPQRSILNNLPNVATVAVGDSLLGNINIEGGNRYTLYPNYQKVASWAKGAVVRKDISSFKPKLTFDPLLTQQAIIDSVQNELIRMMQVTNGAVGENRLIAKYNLQLRLGEKKNISPTLIYFELPESDTIQSPLYYGGTRSFYLPASNMTMHLIFSDSTLYSYPITLQEKGKNYLNIDSITDYKPKNQIVETVYNIFEKNLIRVENSNPYIGIVSDTISYSQSRSKGDLYGGISVGSSDNYALDFADMEFRANEPLYGAVAGISTAGNAKMMIRGMATPNPAKPLMIVDGLPYEGTLEDMATEDVLSMNVLKDEGATALFGSQAANGVIIITTKNGANNDDANPEIAGNSMRRNFHDDAFWQPKLKTGIDGKTSFEIEYPDDITNWNTFFIAIGGKQQYDTKQLSVKSYKALYAQLFTPRFAVRGDSIVNIGKITNYLGDNITVSQTIDFDGQKDQKDISLKNSYTTNIPILANKGDSVQLSYSFKMQNGFFDGEERSYPIIEKGVLQTEGDFRVLNDASSHILNTDPSKGTITFHAESSSLDLFLNDIQRIDRYAYMCNEQMASKVRALLLKEYIDQLKGEKFKEKKKIQNLIKDIEKNRNQNKMWGWWNVENSVFWISKYIINTLLDAEKAGYNVKLDKESLAESLQKTMDANLKAILAFPKNKKLPYAKIELLQSLELIYKLGAKIDYAYYFNQINTLLPDDTSKDQVNSMYTMSIVGLGDKVDTKKLLSLSHKSILGATYWGDASSDKNWFRMISPAETNTAITLLAYKTLRNIGGYDDILANIRNYFLEQRHYNGWQNTYESASILSTITPDMLDKSEKYSSSVLTINGKQISKFPYSIEFPSTTKVEVSKTGTQPLFVTSYQSEWNSNPKVEISKGLQVKTVFTQNADTIANLKEGKSTLLRVNVTLDGDADYIQLEVPIPAGCSYESPYTNYRKESHREYFKDKVVIFCDKLSKGEHQFEISLTPRYTGNYTLNPAKVELMYFPTFYGNDTLKETRIEGEIEK